MLAKVAPTENSNYIEIPINEDGAISVNELRKHFGNCVGIRYRCRSSGNLRGTRVFGDQLQLPLGVSWNDNVFHCVYDGRNNQLTELESNIKCSLSEKFQLQTFDMIALGLPDNITDESFYRYFSKFGKLKMCELRKNLKRPKSKGYGFLRYDNFDDQHECIKTEHVIGRTAVCLRLPTAKMDNSACKRKLFVTNITPSVTLEDILEYFSVFGKIVEIFMPPASNPHAFLTFDSENSILRIFRFGDSHRVFGGYVVVEKVYTKQEMQIMSRSKTENTTQDYFNDQYQNNQLDNEQNYYENITQVSEWSNNETSYDKRYQYQYNFDNSIAPQTNSYQPMNYYYFYPQQYQYEENNYDQQNCGQLSQEKFTYGSNEEYLLSHYHNDGQQQEHSQASYPEGQYNYTHNFDSMASYQTSNFNYPIEPQQFPGYLNPNELYSNRQTQNPPKDNYYFPQQSTEHFSIANQKMKTLTFPSQFSGLPIVKKSNPFIQQQLTQNIPNADITSNQNNGYPDNSISSNDPLRNFNTGNIPRQIISDIASCILEEASLSNEKDIFVNLLTEQLTPSKSVNENNFNNTGQIIKGIKLLQNPTVLNSLIRLSENKPDDKSNGNN